MARNGSGTFSSPYPNFVSGTVISSTQVDANNSDIATALTQSIAVDGQSTVTANLPMNAKKLTGLAVGAAATDSLNLGQAQAEAMVWCGTAGGSANAITLSPTPAITAYAAGQRFVWKASGSVNTGATTVAISGLGTIALQDNGSALAAGQHQANKIFMGILDTTSTVQVTQVQISGTDPLIVTSLTVSGTATIGGILSVDDTTTSTSGTTGSIHTDGGLGVAGTAFVAGAAKIVGVTTHGDDVVSDTDSVDDLGTTGVRWANLFVDAITATDQVTATGFTGTLDGILGSGAAAAATVTTIDASGVATATTFEPDGDTSAGDNAAMGYTSVLGAILTGQGSTNDVTLVNDADATVLGIPTGTTNVTIAGSVTVAGIGGTGLSHRNVIQNGDFRIAQRGPTGVLTTAIGYRSMDRWVASQDGGSVTGNFDQVAAANGDGFEYYARIRRSADSTNVTAISARHQIESHDLVPLQGKEVTLSWVAKAGAQFSAASSAMLINVYYGTTADQASNNPGGWAGFGYSLQTTQVITTSFVKYSTTFTVNANAKEMQVQLGFTPVGTAGADDSINISNVQLEEGGIATDFEYFPYEQSLALCQRYLYKLEADTADKGMGLMGQAYGTAASILPFVFPVTPRTKVTGITISGATDFSLTVAASGRGTTTGLTFGAAFPNGVWLTGSVSSGLAAGDAVTLWSAVDDAFILFTGAEL